MTESGEIIGFNLDLVAERPLVAQTRFAEDGSIGVDWRGRCWAWLNGDEAPALAEVVVNDAETARLLFPGQVRRVRAMVRAVETAAGRVAGLEVLTDLGWEPRTEPCAAARGLHEGGRRSVSSAVRFSDSSMARWARCSGIPAPPSRWTAGGTARESGAWNP